MEKKYICLSFDDGPCKGSPDTMTDMLNLLEKYQIVGSFFVIGNKVTEENKKVIKRAFDMGCDIQNHSWTHPDMTQLTPEKIREEYEKCDKVIEEITGAKAEYFRPPYIAVNADMYREIKVPFICGKGCMDWDNNYDADYREKTMLESAEDGCIYLLHVMEGNDATLKAVDRVVPELKKQGYEFVTVPELFKIKNQTNGVNGANWSVVK